MTRLRGQPRRFALPAPSPGRAPVNARIIAARVLAEVIDAGQSLADTLPSALARVPPRDRGLLQELCYGTLRWYPLLEFLLGRLLDRPLRPRDRDVRALLLLGLYQLLHLRVPDYAAVSATVAAAHELGKPWAAGLVNALLRAFQRRRGVLLAELEADEAVRSAHPAWLLERLKADWPEAWPAVAAAANARPPQSLRVNLSRVSREQYLERLAVAGIEASPGPFAATAVTLAAACEVEHLPGFREGLVSVQDQAAQLAAGLLDLRPGLRVLDACAAPGGKTCHILEAESRLSQVLALDKDAKRLQRVRENLDRLGLKAQLVAGDALRPSLWWDGVPFDRILLDAPCSGSGVIRRHPDIKLLRRPSDIDELGSRQRALLAGLWPLLSPGGMLVYATCSVLRQENERIVADFLAAHPDARDRPISAGWGRQTRYGRQILTGEADMDGFFYARLIKNQSA